MTKTVELEACEIEYLRELVSEAWMYKRPSKLSDREQSVLALKLKQAVEA